LRVRAPLMKHSPRSKNRAALHRRRRPTIGSHRRRRRMIVKEGSKFSVKSEKGKNLGTYSSREEAEHRLQQVEHFKHLKEHKRPKTRLGQM
jgi:hypothetical protein